MTKIHANRNVQAETPSAEAYLASHGYELSSHVQAENRFLVKTEIAERLRKTPRTIETWTRKGILPCLRIGRSVLYSWGDVEAQLRQKFTLNRPSSDTPKKNGTTTRKS